MINKEKIFFENLSKIEDFKIVKKMLRKNGYRFYGSGASTVTFIKSKTDHIVKLGDKIDLVITPIRKNSKFKKLLATTLFISTNRKVIIQERLIPLTRFGYNKQDEILNKLSKLFKLSRGKLDDLYDINEFNVGLDKNNKTKIFDIRFTKLDEPDYTYYAYDPSWHWHVLNLDY